jgi:hypothetical protein
MKTLTEYTISHFPNHVTDQTRGDMTLTSHTVVAHVVGLTDGMEMARRVRDVLPDTDVGSVMVHPTEPSVSNTGGEDPDGVVDLPRRRVVSSGIVGGVVVGAAVGVIVGLVSDSLATGVISGVFAAILGAVVAAMVGGGGRYAGNRAWEQPQAPDRTITVVAAFTRSEDEALDAARVMEMLDPFEVRIVSADGAWRSPNT